MGCRNSEGSWQRPDKVFKVQLHVGGGKYPSVIISYSTCFGIDRRTVPSTSFTTRLLDNSLLVWKSGRICGGTGLVEGGSSVIFILSPGR